jgi:hypothetical protein
VLSSQRAVVRNRVVRRALLVCQETSGIYERLITAVKIAGVRRSRRVGGGRRTCAPLRHDAERSQPVPGQVQASQRASVATVNVAEVIPERPTTNDRRSTQRSVAGGTRAVISSKGTKVRDREMGKAFLVRGKIPTITERFLAAVKGALPHESSRRCRFLRLRRCGPEVRHMQVCAVEGVRLCTCTCR